MQSPATTASLLALEPIVIKCGEPERRLHRIKPLPPRHIGAFDGEKYSRCRGYEESYGAARAMLWLISVTACLFVAAMILGAL